MKKFILTIGTLSAITAPIAAVVACGSRNDEEKYVAPTIKEMALSDAVANSLKSGLNKKMTKEAAITKIKGIIKDANLQKKYVDFVNNQDSWMTAYYLILSAIATNAQKTLGTAFLAVSETFKNANGWTTGDEANADSKISKAFVNKITSGKLTVKDIVDTLVSKFSGEDTDFKFDVVKVTAEYIKDTKTFKPTSKMMWDFVANASLGNSEGAKYIIENAGYKISSPSS